MALENIGIGGVLKFDAGPAISGMNSAAEASRNLSVQQQNLAATAASVNEAASKVNAGAFMAGAKVLSDEVSGVFLGGLKTAADYEQQLDAVAAVAGATSKELDDLGQAALMAGFNGVYSAKEAAQGEEELARAGFTASESIQGLSGVMNAAAADAIPIATSARIVSATLRGLGLDASEATRVADVLAKTSAATATDITGLGESMKYAVTQSRQMGIDLETTSAILGALSDAGLRGSIGGTSFTNMLVKLSRPSKEANKWLAANNVAMKTFADGSFDVVGTISDISSHLSGMTNVMEKARITQELFGIRGAKAFGALEASMQSGRFPKLLEDIRNSEGEAERMAQTRIHNFNGAMTQLKNTMEGFSIVTMGQMLAPFTDNLFEVRDLVKNFALAINDLNRGVADGPALAEKYGAAIAGLALGVTEGIQTVKNAWDTFTGAIKSFLGDSALAQTTQTFAKWAVIIFAVVAALAPVLAIIGTIGFIVSAVIVPGIAAIADVIGGALLPVLAAVAVLFLAMRREGESFGSVIVRMFTMIGDVGRYIWSAISEDFFGALADQFGGIENLKAAWEAFSQAAILVFKAFVGGISRALEGFGQLFRIVMAFMGAIVGQFIGNSDHQFNGFFSAVIEGAKIMGQALLTVLQFVLQSLQTFMKPIVHIADFTGLSKNSTFFADMAFFTSQNFDLTGELQKNVQTAENLGTGEKDGRAAEAQQQDGVLATIEKYSGDIMKSLNGPPKVQVGVDLNDKRQLEINNCMQVNGRQLALAQAQHKQEINERAGFRATPWQRRQMLEQGAVPATGGGND